MADIFQCPLVQIQIRSDACGRQFINNEIFPSNTGKVVLEEGQFVGVTPSLQKVPELVRMGLTGIFSDPVSSQLV